MPQTATQQPEIDLAQSIRDLKAQVDAKLAAFNEMTARRKETQNELVTLAATFDDEMTRLSAELGDHLAANDVVRQVAAEKAIFSLRGRREKLEAHLAAFDSSLDKQRRVLAEMKSSLVSLERDYYVDLFESHKAKLDIDHMLLTWALSQRAGWRADDAADFYGRLLGGGPGSSPRDPAKVPGMPEKLAALSPYAE